jgi:hypothetical protein
MMGAQDQAGSVAGGMSARPGGSSQGAGGGEARRGPGLWAAVLAFGLLVVMTAGSLRALRGRGERPASEPFEQGADDSIDAIAIMGGQRFDGGTGEFRTADAVAIMGHSVLDLRKARVRGERAVIDVVAIMGHVEILVPPDWEVATGDMLSAGAVRNQARKSEAENPKQVRIDGAVLMGRLDVRR